MKGSLAAGGGHSGRGPAVGFARLAAGLLLPHSFPSQVTGDRAGGGLGRLRAGGEQEVRGCFHLPPPLPSHWSPERHTHCSGDSSTVAMNGRVDFPKKKLAHQCPGSALGRPKRSEAKSECCSLPGHGPGDRGDTALTRVVGNGFPRVLGTSAGAVTGSGAQAAWREEAHSAPRGTGPPVHPAKRWLHQQRRPVPRVLSSSFPSRIQVLKQPVS